VANIDYRSDLAIVGVVPGPGGEEVVAIAQYFLDPKTREAEVAFVVHDEWQAKGMGTYLLKYLAQVARQRGVRRFFATVLPTNKAMLAVFHNSGYKVNTAFDGEAYSVAFDLAAD
jgi:GNAT superfamily N-acetyltransferase